MERRHQDGRHQNRLIFPALPPAELSALSARSDTVRKLHADPVLDRATKRCGSSTLPNRKHGNGDWYWNHPRSEKRFTVSFGPKRTGSSSSDPVPTGRVLPKGPSHRNARAGKRPAGEAP